MALPFNQNRIANSNNAKGKASKEWTSAPKLWVLISWNQVLLIFATRFKGNFEKWVKVCKTFHYKYEITHHWCYHFNSVTTMKMSNWEICLSLHGLGLLFPRYTLCFSQAHGSLSFLAFLELGRALSFALAMKCELKRWVSFARGRFKLELRDWASKNTERPIKPEFQINCY